MYGSSARRVLAIGALAVFVAGLCHQSSLSICISIRPCLHTLSTAVVPSRPQGSAQVVVVSASIWHDVFATYVKQPLARPGYTGSTTLTAATCPGGTHLRATGALHSASLLHGMPCRQSSKL